MKPETMLRDGLRPYDQNWTTVDVTDVRRRSHGTSSTKP